MSASVMAADDSAPGRVHVVDRETERLLDLRGREAGGGRERSCRHRHDVAVVLGEAQHRAVVPRHPPAIGEGRDAAVEMRLQGRRKVFHRVSSRFTCQTRISTIGMLGIWPASK